MFRLVMLVMLTCGVSSAQPPVPAVVSADPYWVSVLLSPAGGETFAKNSTPSFSANVAIGNTRFLWVYLEVKSLDNGNTYYFGDVQGCYAPGGTVTFAPCSALPSGNYIATISTDLGGTCSALFKVAN